MVNYESYMFEFSVSKDMERKEGCNKRSGGREGNGTFMSNANHQRIEN
jgi:hypothetical protein